MTAKTLRDWIPMDGDVHPKSRLYKLLDQPIVESYGWRDNVGWPGRERNVTAWVKLANGLAVGHNENPSRGWSFPIIRIK